MHIASRLFVGATFLLTAVLNHSIAIALLQLTLFVLVMLNYENGRKRIFRAISLLRWLVLPIILLHALFTPGALILSGMAWPVSIEGLQSGVWFSLHLIVIFFAAMLFSQLLTQREWINGSLKIPRIGHAMVPYALLINRCWQRIRLMLGDVHSVWRKEDRRLRTFFIHLGTMPVQAMRISHEVAIEIWYDWDQQVIDLVDKKDHQHVSAIATLLALITGLLMWFGTFFGGI